MIHLKRSEGQILLNPNGPRTACGSLAQQGGDRTVGLLAFEAAVNNGETVCMFCEMELEALNAQLSTLLTRHEGATL
jgi:hypothetical protein